MTQEEANGILGSVIGGLAANCGPEMTIKAIQFWACRMKLVERIPGMVAESEYGDFNDSLPSPIQ